MTRKQTTSYVVGNPRGIPAATAAGERIPILVQRVREEDGTLTQRPFYEGDTVTASDFPPAAWARFTDQGFIVPESPPSPPSPARGGRGLKTEA